MIPPLLGVAFPALRARGKTLPCSSIRASFLCTVQYRNNINEVRGRNQRARWARDDTHGGRKPIYYLLYATEEEEEKKGLLTIDLLILVCLCHTSMRSSICVSWFDRIITSNKPRSGWATVVDAAVYQKGNRRHHCLRPHPLFLPS